MSRHSLQPRPDRPDIAEAYIGWAAPMQSFTVAAYTSGNKLRLWGGHDAGRPKLDAARAIALIEPFAIVPPDLLAQLERDRLDSAEAR